MSEDHPRPAMIGAGLQRIVADSVAYVGGMKVSELSARRIILRLREMGAEVVYTSQVEQWGEMANCCVFRETGKKCPFCRCGGRNMGMVEP